MKTVFIILVAVGLFFFDQLSKYFAFHHLAFLEEVFLFFDYFSLTLVFNYGAAWGIFQHQLFFLLLMHVLVLGLLIWYWPVLRGAVWCGRALPWLLGGVLGNAFDRIRLGFVIDFLKIGQFPVFNFADIYLNIALVCLILGFIKGEAIFR
eukprot:COSAG01_NODE_2_length_63927_cov_1357.611941_27_plen_150_part_00